MQNGYLSPAEIAEYVVSVGQSKAELSISKQLVLGILAGAFIAFASQGSNEAIHTIKSVGLGKSLAGALFATGLILVVVAGGELFTGNSLMVMALAERRITLRALLRSWIVVYVGNLIGSVLVAYLVLKTGQLKYTEGLLGGFTIKIAASKTGLIFRKAFIMGILCNWLVCLAVGMAYGAKDVAGKVLAIFFPIWLFVTSGFEHSVANMYYIPAGIMAKADPLFMDKALELGVTLQQMEALNWRSMFLANLLPVTLGNILGGTLFVGLAYWFAYLKDARS
ncbi:formate/nitrite transporter family protein [Fretibacterium sp. OH1220_COT-178]|uniref:formate/nitrite transporter family protein n=1 Tax=Fretibacterium sp. OH1220_COT-178 TaxID=2491047 RepID=UPI000F5FF634|nr:formate/nitrite transporter family protein [Fretibacterium sp. OH1220_COT-178]RRD64601.1 formate/nitrite transporter family protein [Fretibacterium sp. OH1220_COT-178]